MHTVVDAYEIEGGAIQVDTSSASYVFGPSRMRGGATEALDVQPPEFRSGAAEALVALRVHLGGAPLPWER